MTIGCLVLVGAPKARAQDFFDRDQSLDVATRPHPEYDPIGIRESAFVIHPEVTAGVAANDNILPEDARTLSDVVFTAKPEVTANSDWGRHALNLTANTIITRYASHPSLDSLQWNVSGDGRLDVHHDLTVTAQVSQDRILLPTISDAYLPQMMSPLLYDQTRVSVNPVEQLGRVKLSLTGTFEHFAYLDGLTTSGQKIDEQFRDRFEYITDARADIAISPDFAFFVEEDLTYDAYNRDKFRNRNTEETLVGPNFQITRLIVAELGVGYLSGSFSDPTAKRVGTLHGREKVSYYATSLLTFTFTGRQGVIDSGIPASPAIFNKNLELKADYELFRNLIISSTTTANWNDYLSIDRHDQFYGTGLNGTYRVNRTLSVVLAFDHTSRSSSGVVAGKRFGEDTLSLSLGMKL